MTRPLGACLIAACAIAAPFAVTANAAAPANVVGHSAEVLTGQWRGVFFNGGAATPFDAFVFDDGGQLIGSTTEINTFGSADAAFLLADVAGTVRNGRVNFEKTYNGVGGVTHTVRYQGQVSRDGRRITGTWTLAGSSDRFEMVR